MKELIFELSQNLGFLLLFIVGTIAVIVVFASIIRWVFRIEKIVELLQQISDQLPNPKPHEKG
jgi:uncharacterized membrane protein